MWPRSEGERVRNALGAADSVVGFFFSSRRRHTRCSRDWSSDVCSSDLGVGCGSAQGLKIVARLAQMHGVRSDVAYLENPLLAEGTLHGQVPLLGVGHNKIGRASCRERV